jgi:hypothetical protein
MQEDFGKGRFGLPRCQGDDPLREIVVMVCVLLSLALT